MIRRSLLGLLWVGFILYAFKFAPPDQPDTLALIQQLSTGDWNDLNPAIVALFNLMGVWPMVYACLALCDGHGQRIPAWPFVVGSFGLGAFLLLPYLILRQPHSTFSQPLSRGLKLIDSRWWGVGLFGVSLVLLGYGIYAGDWSDFWRQWQTSRFIHVMSIDFCLLWLLVPSLLGDDMARRQVKNPLLLGWASAVPLLGVTAYLALRPRLAAAAEDSP